MPEYGFSLTRIFPYKNSYFPVDSILIRENTDHRKPVFWHTFKQWYIYYSDASLN